MVWLQTKCVTCNDIGTNINFGKLYSTTNILRVFTRIIGVLVRDI